MRKKEQNEGRKEGRRYCREERKKESIIRY